MTDANTPTTDEKISEDFLYFLGFFKEAYDSLKKDGEKEICKKWLDKLVVGPHKTTSERQIRNIYLSQLILSINERKLRPPFNVPPEQGPLSLDGVFQDIMAKPETAIKQENEMNKAKEQWAEFVRDRELEMIDLSHLSKDGRTFVACKTLPKNAGVFTYVAVSMGGDADCGWVNTQGRPIAAPEIRMSDMKVETAKETENNCFSQNNNVQKITAEVRSVLAKRKPPEARMFTYQFYKSMYDSIEQEMLSEQDPNSSACHDPYIEKMLEMLTSDIQACGKASPQMFNRMKMLSMLKKRVKAMLQNIEKRNSNLSSIEASSSSPTMALTNPASSCSNAMSEMMWQEALLEKPTSKVAEALAKTYPVCLVKTLLALLARERRKIINRMKERQEKLIVAMKRDLQDEIRRGIDAYKVARMEWVNVMRIVLHYNKLKGALTDKELGDSSDKKGEYLQETIRKEIENTKKRLDVANQKNDTLQEDICELNKTLHELTEKVEVEEQQAIDQLRDLKNEICSEKSSIVQRTQTIEELERMLKEIQK
ncbi:uncharacterized protein LOC126837169 [Adelges cooleyi]|uniref:uncharacterized protein LOC126837169 n=1 Tax=Adelges cooleyi TaxID=133065 RepID=UPI00217F2D50|nr:uncharacterized protein LOC126837169 [Adelges cooleyi]